MPYIYNTRPQKVRHVYRPVCALPWSEANLTPEHGLDLLDVMGRVCLESPLVLDGGLEPLDLGLEIRQLSADMQGVHAQSAVAPLPPPGPLRYTAGGTDDLCLTAI